MIRANLLMLALCTPFLLHPAGPAAAQGAAHASPAAPSPAASAKGQAKDHDHRALRDADGPRESCAAHDLSCSVMIPGIAAMASTAFAPRPDGSSAPQGQGPTISVAPLTLAEPASKARMHIQVGSQVGSKQPLPEKAFLRIRGLPPTVAVRDGHAIAAGTWAVPLSALPDLVITVPDGPQGWSEIAISLVTADGSVLAQARTKLVVALPSHPNAAAAASQPWLTPEDRERALQFHGQGVEALRVGNIVAARRFFERGAEAGLAQSVMALAATFDPNELAKLGSFGPRPDLEIARTWYRKARDLGASDAAERLRRLGAAP
jgi:hypothetical protein